ncbi:MAG: hypothetical protein JSR36_18650 [Proteobacteria bacterium]|nr:hypothetical protein [Pseudomonadota bacterium]
MPHPQVNLRLGGAVLAMVLALACGTARATDWQLSIDTRLVSSDADRSVMDGGFGPVRFDREDAALQLGRLRLALTQAIAELWSVHLDASVYDDKGGALAGFSEAFVQWRPYPRAGYRLRLKAGGFYAPVSLENRAAGWDSPYTLSYSAIDSWLAVEVRTLGLEANLDWLGTRLGHDFDLGVTAAVFGWNQGAGTVLAGTGFSLTDRQTPLFGRVGQPGPPLPTSSEPFVQIDGRLGGYGGLEARYLDRLTLRVLRYDNRADPSATNTVANTIAWNTRFTSAGLRAESAGGWTGIVQWLQGETRIAPGGFEIEWPFESAYALVSRRWGPHTFSGRYDRFSVEVRGIDGDGAQSGHAWTAAYGFEPNAHWRFTLEWLQVQASSYNRDEYVGSPWSVQTQVQLAVRYSLGSTNR